METEEHDSLSERSIKNIRATLRRILASAKEWGEIAAIPNLPEVKVADAGWNFDVKEETERLIGACRGDEERAPLLFAIRTGARAGADRAGVGGRRLAQPSDRLPAVGDARGDGADEEQVGEEGAADGDAERALRQIKPLRGRRSYSTSFTSGFGT